jgi:hypothetical protein
MMDGDFRVLRWERGEVEGMVEAVGLWDGEGVKVRLVDGERGLKWTTLSSTRRKVVVCCGDAGGRRRRWECLCVDVL